MRSDAQRLEKKREEAQRPDAPVMASCDPAVEQSLGKNGTD